jgi:hypothetical protein
VRQISTPRSARDLRGLVEHDLDHTWIASLAGISGDARQLARALAGLNVAQRHDGALALGDGLVRDHQQLSVAQLHAIRRRGVGDQRREIVTCAHLGQAGEGTGGERRHRRAPLSGC